MTCTPDEYLSASHALLEVTPCPEGYLRAVASRSYYAAYHSAKAFHASLPAPGSVWTAKGSHEQLISQLRHPTVKTNTERAMSVAIGNLLMGAFEHRVNADYKPEGHFHSRDAHDAVSKAQQIIEASAAGIEKPAQARPTGSVLA
jgi:uncharacterized protein (UPF0332 family)